MKLKSMGASVARRFTSQVITAKKHSPAALFVVGIVGVGTTAVLAGRAALKISDILEESNDELSVTIEVDKNTAEGNEELVKKATFGLQLRTAIKIARACAPAAIFGIATVGALTGSYVILQRRNAGLVAAYGVMHRGFEEYRARVVEDQGAEKDLAYRYGTVDKEFAEETKNGTVVKTVKVIDTDNIDLKNGYARWYDGENPNWNELPNQNTHYIQGIEQTLNNRLRLGRIVFLNEAYALLGMPKTPEGHLVGWVANSKKGDGYIAITPVGDQVHQDQFAMGRVMELLLDFNVDGVVYDLIDKV